MKNKSISYTSIIFMAYIPLGLFFSSIDYINGKRYSVFVFSFLMGVLAYLLVPYSNWDLSRHYELYDLLKTKDAHFIFEYGQSRYFFFYLYVWVVSHLGINKEFLPFISVFTSYYIYMYVFGCCMAKYNLTVKERIFGTIVLLSLIPFIGIASSLRQHLAFAFVLLSLYNLFILSNKIKYYIYIFAACIIHPVCVVVFMLVLISSTFKMKLTKVRLNILFVLLLTGIFGFLFNELIDLFLPFLNSNNLYIASYMNVDVIDTSFSDNSFFRKVALLYISPLLFYVFVFFGGYIEQCCTNEKLTSFLMFLLLFILIVQPSVTAFDRFSFLFSIIFLSFVFPFVLKVISGYRKKLFYSAIIFWIVAFNFFSLYQVRYTFSSWSDVFTTPFLFLFLNTVHNPIQI